VERGKTERTDDLYVVDAVARFMEAVGRALATHPSSYDALDEALSSHFEALDIFGVGINVTENGIAFSLPACLQECEPALAAANAIASAFVRNMASDSGDLARLDPLTGVGNRRAFDERLRSEWSRAMRGDYSLALIMLDIDHFGAYNNRYGHPAGDECLRRVASALQSALRREADAIFRYGGEEFAALLPATDVAGAVAVAERMREALAEAAIVHEDTKLGRITVSAGAAASLAVRDGSAERVLCEADALLLRAKEAGRNRVAAEEYESVTQANPRTYRSSRDLPSFLTLFVGREAERSDLRRLLDEKRLVTVTGPGGIGKSRLACEAVAEDRFADGIVYIDFSTIDSGEMAILRIARALDVQSSQEDAIEGIAAALGSSQRLLLLDNCERVHEAVGEALCRILQACPNVHALATSQLALKALGETEYRIEPMQPLEAGRLLRSRLDAAAGSRWYITPESLDALVERVGWSPLAIELIAPQVVEHGADRTIEQLQTSDFVLTSRVRSADARRRNLRDILAWSYNLLTPAAQALFPRICVFEAAVAEGHLAAVAAAGDDSASPAIAELEQKRLIRREPHTGRVYVPPIERRFGLSILSGNGEEAHYRERHATYYVKLVCDFAWDRTQKPVQNAAPFVREHETDVTSALRFLFGRTGPQDEAVSLAAAMCGLWDACAHMEEAIYWIDRALSAEPRCGKRAIARALYSAATIANTLSNVPDAIAAGERAATLFMQLGDETMHFHAKALAAIAVYYSGDYAKAEGMFAQCVDAARRTGDLEAEATYLMNLANTALDQGDLERAANLYRAAIGIQEQMNSFTGMAIALVNLGMATALSGDNDSAILHLERSLAIFSDRDHPARGVSMSWLCHAYTKAARMQDAYNMLVRATELYRSLRSPRWAAVCVEKAAQYALAAGDAGLAAVLFSFVEEYIREHAVPTSEIERRVRDDIRNAICRAGVDLNAAAARAQALTLDEVLEAAQSARQVSAKQSA
jgi:diguanylate cyclase (GGDEF)-like protein